MERRRFRPMPRKEQHEGRPPAGHNLDPARGFAAIPFQLWPETESTSLSKVHERTPSTIARSGIVRGFVRGGLRLSEWVRDAEDRRRDEGLRFCHPQDRRSLAARHGRHRNRRLACGRRRRPLPRSPTQLVAAAGLQLRSFPAPRAPGRRCSPCRCAWTFCLPTCLR